MQPYFLPYLGYFQLIHAVDAFVVYDDIQFTKRGWIRRNRILTGNQPSWITLPLEHDSDYLDIRQRRIASTFDRDKLLRRIRASYERAPRFASTIPLIAEIVGFESANLFDFLFHSIECVCARLGIGTRLIVASTLPVDASLRKQDRVLAIARACGADGYVNPVSGEALYSRAEFAAHGITLEFLRTEPFEYAQFSPPHVPDLSIVDLLMFADEGTLGRLLERYQVS